MHVATKLVLRRSPWPPWFLAASAWIIGARVRRTGASIRRHTLLVCNHTSWLDILILGGATKCAFVSKDELGHPLVHWMADQNATVYVKRTHRKGAKDQAIAIANALEDDKPVALFPEGTTGPGTHLLPFRSTLLEAANFAAKDVEIRPVAIDYGAAAAAEIGWWQEVGQGQCPAAAWPTGEVAGHGECAFSARSSCRPQAACASGARGNRPKARLQVLGPLAYRRGE